MNWIILIMAVYLKLCFAFSMGKLKTTTGSAFAGGLQHSPFF
jgi:hypothetical protein